MRTSSDQYQLISADDHVDLAHDAIKANLASRFHRDYDDAVGRFRSSMGSFASAAANQLWREQQGYARADEAAGSGELRSMSMKERRHPAARRPGHTDALERVKDMDQDGVQSSVTYCEVSAFRYLYLLKSGAREATRAFNQTLTEWASAAPDRLIINHQVPVHDIESAVAEVRHAADSGCKSLQLPVFPVELGLPDYWDARYDPLWAAVQETGLPICLHIGLNTQLDGLARRDPTPQKGIFVPMTPLTSAEALGMWVLTGVLERFPELKVVFVEPGIGWVSWWLYIVDDMMTRQDYEYPGLKELPSHYFRRNISLTFVDEPDVLRHAHDRIGVENVMWSSDYPHPVSSWPNSQQIAAELFADSPDHERELVLSGNAARVWNL
jgi:predicted TIM-barrel fold metal-dependent hydrolase